MLLLEVTLLGRPDHSTRLSSNPILEPKLHLNLDLLSDKNAKL